MHGDICDPDVIMVVYSNPVREVEHVFSPWVVEGSVQRVQRHNRIHIDWLCSNVMIWEVEKLSAEKTVTKRIWLVSRFSNWWPVITYRCPFTLPRTPFNSKPLLIWYNRTVWSPCSTLHPKSSALCERWRVGQSCSLRLHWSDLILVRCPSFLLLQGVRLMGSYPKIYLRGEQIIDFAERVYNNITKEILIFVYR